MNYNIVFVILNYKDAARTKQQVLRCKGFNIFSHIIIVDNNSCDGSTNILQDICDARVNLIESHKNGGFAQGNNLGARYALKYYKPDYILFANPDTIFKDSDVLACIDCLNAHPDLGLVSMRMLDTDGNEGIGAWRYRSYSDYLLSSFWLYRHFYSTDSWVYKSFQSSFQYVDMVRGSFMCFRADALSQAGLFDPDTFLYYEEEIISYRLKSIGFKVGILSDRWYIHNQIGGKMSVNWSLYPYYSKSLLIFLRKYYNISLLKQLLFIIFSKYSILELKIVENIKHHILKRE